MRTENHVRLGGYTALLECTDCTAQQTYMYTTSCPPTAKTHERHADPVIRKPRDSILHQKPLNEPVHVCVRMHMLKRNSPVHRRVAPWVAPDAAEVPTVRHVQHLNAVPACVRAGRQASRHACAIADGVAVLLWWCCLTCKLTMRSRVPANQGTATTKSGLAAAAR